MSSSSDTIIAPSQAHDLTRREVLCLSAYFFLFFAGLSFVLSFGPVFLQSRGLDLSQIAVLFSAYAAAGMFAQGRVGHLSDFLGTRKWFAVAASVLLGISYLLYSFAYSFWAFLPLYMWSGICFLSGLTLPQAIVSDWTSATGSTASRFSYTRIWGTVGFIIPLFIAIIWPSVAEGTRFLYWIAVLYIVSAVPMLILRDAPVTKTTGSALSGAVRVLKSNKAYIFILCYAAIRLCETGSASFIGIYVKDLGGGGGAIAAAYLLAAAAEAPFVLFAGSISDRIGRKLPLLLSFAAWPVRLFILASVDSPTGVHLVQLLHGPTFGIMLICSVAYMSDVSPRDLRGTGQGLLMVANGFAMMIGPALIGFLADSWGLASVFQWLAFATIVPFLVFALLAKEPSRGVEK